MSREIVLALAIAAVCLSVWIEVERQKRIDELKRLVDDLQRTQTMMVDWQEAATKSIEQLAGRTEKMLKEMRGQDK